MRLDRFVLVVFGFVCLIAKAETEKSIYFEIRSDTVSEATAIDSFLNEFDGKFLGGEYAFTEDHLELGAKWGNTSFSYVLRYEQYIGFSNDLARFYHENSNDLPNSYSHYKVKLDADEFYGDGLKLSYQWPLLDRLKVSIAGTWLRAYDLTEGTASGGLSSGDNFDFLADINIRLNSSEDLILEKEVDSPDGQGYTLDASIEWEPNEHWYVNLQLIDVYSEIQWQDVLYSELSLSNVNRGITNGKLEVSPFINGKQSIQDFDQQLVRKNRLEVRCKNDKLGVYLAFNNTAYFTHSTIGFTTPGYFNGSFDINWSPEREALGLGYRNEFFSLTFSTDSLNTKKNQTLQFSTGIHFSW